MIQLKPDDWVLIQRQRKSIWGIMRNWHYLIEITHITNKKFKFKIVLTPTSRNASGIQVTQNTEAKFRFPEEQDYKHITNSGDKTPKGILTMNKNDTIVRLGSLRYKIVKVLTKKQKCEVMTSML